jgi:magnesium transporter
MISRYTYHDVTWIDIESPSKEEISHIMEEFAVPELIGEEMLSSTLRSKVELYDKLVYVILHFPTNKGKNGKTGEQEIDFIVGKNFLITVRYDTIDPVHEFSKMFESSSMINKEKMATHGGYIFVQMMKELYKTSLSELDELTKTVKDIEYGIFNGQEEAMVKQISHTSRKLLDFKQAVRFHRDILKSYETASTRLFGTDYGYYANLVTSEFNKVNSLLESNRDALSELQRTNDSLLSTKTNDIMRTFTIMTFVMMPLTIITGVFGMNTTSDLIFIQNKSDFLFVVGAMTLTGLVMFLFFKLRKWL